jgi:hypothetical protein
VTFEVINVNSHSLGVEGIEQETLRKTNVVLIPRNTPLPATFTETFVTKTEQQQSIVIQVLEGESSSPDECTPIGRTVVRNLPRGLPKGWPVEVTFEYGSNGRLSVRAIVPGTDQQAGLELHRVAGLSDEGLAQWKQLVDTSAGFDTFQERILAFEELVMDVLDSDDPDPPSGYTQATSPPTGPTDGNRPPENNSAGPSAADCTDGPTKNSRPTAAPAETNEVATGDAARHPHAARRPVKWRAVINVVGHVVAAILGLGVGYLLLSKFRPESFPLPW